MSRDITVKIRLTADMKDKFQGIADEYGMTMSGLGAYVIGSYVKQHQTVLNPLMDKFGDKVMELMNEQIKEIER